MRRCAARCGAAGRTVGNQSDCMRFLRGTFQLPARPTRSSARHATGNEPARRAFVTGCKPVRSMQPDEATFFAAASCSSTDATSSHWARRGRSGTRQAGAQAGTRARLPTFHFRLSGWNRQASLAVAPGFLPSAFMISNGVDAMVRRGAAALCTGAQCAAHRCTGRSTGCQGTRQSKEGAQTAVPVIRRGAKLSSGDGRAER